VRRALVRQLTKRSRVPPVLRATLAVILGALAVAGLAVPNSQGQTTATTTPGASPITGPTAPAKAPDPPGPGNPTKAFPTSPALLAEGFSLYQGSCSSCHGIALNGTPGVAPSLRGVGAGPVDFYLSTGRMPLEQPREEPMRGTPQFNRTQMDALIDYVSTFGGPPAPTVNTANGNLALGLHEFTLNCAGCHQVVARGGLTVNVPVPDLLDATPQQIAEAVRMGPYLMPHFDANQINQHELDSIARYVIWTRRPVNSGGWGLYNLGPIPEGIVAWFIALLAMVIVARLIGERLA
jgi:quinol---cytochrome-c reductase cytochrome c subunit